MILYSEMTESELEDASGKIKEFVKSLPKEMIDYENNDKERL